MAAKSIKDMAAPAMTATILACGHLEHNAAGYMPQGGH
jgi:hypothetical protein